MAGTHLKYLQGTQGYSIEAVADVNQEAINKLKTICPWIGETLEFSDYKSMIESTDLDAVIIVTPHSLHYEQTVFALRHDLHVLIEKPMVTRAVEAEEIVRLSRDRQRIAMVAYQRHTEPKYIYARGQVASGKMGKVNFMTAYQTQGWLRDISGTWRTDPTFNELGYVSDSGSHLIDAVIWICGSEAEEVFARIDRLSSAVPVNASVFIRFENGALATVSLVGGAPEWREEARFYCDFGEVICSFNYDENYAAINTSVEILDKNNSKLERPLKSLPPRSNPTRNFLASILGLEEPACTAIDGLRTARILEAIQDSAASGKPVPIKHTEL